MSVKPFDPPTNLEPNHTPYAEGSIMAETRPERDSMGELTVPALAYYGAQTQRAAQNFQISRLRFPREYLWALGLIKKSAAQANTDLGNLAADLAEPIIRAASAVAEGKHDDQFVLDIFQTGSGTSTNMNANEVIAGLANEAKSGVRGGRTPVHPNDAVNMSQSSNDVIPTALHIAALHQISRHLIPALRTLHDRLARRAEAFDNVIKTGRTHLQDAVPIRLGQEFSGYASAVEHGIQRVEHCCVHLSELPIGGTAVGTGLNCHPEFPGRIVAALSQATGLPLRLAANSFECMAQRDAAVEASGAIKTVAVSLSNIANNLRLLGSGPRCGLGEIRLPELQPGSSIMPGKVNPVISEAVMMVTAKIVGNDATITWANALGSNFELNVMMPIIIHALLESIEILGTAAEHLANKCVDATQYLAGTQHEGVTRVEADLDRCAELAEKSLAIGTALAPRIGYDNAVAIARTAYREGRTIRDVAMELSGLSPKEAAGRLGHSASAAFLQAHGGYPKEGELQRLLDLRAMTDRGTGARGAPSG
jgi:fumarate hydratase class II